MPDPLVSWLGWPNKSLVLCAVKILSTVLFDLIEYGAVTGAVAEKAAEAGGLAAAAADSSLAAVFLPALPAVAVLGDLIATAEITAEEASFRHDHGDPVATVGHYARRTFFDSPTSSTDSRLSTAPFHNGAKRGETSLDHLNERSGTSTRDVPRPFVPMAPKGNGKGKRPTGVGGKTGGSPGNGRAAGGRAGTQKLSRSTIEKAVKDLYSPTSKAYLATIANPFVRSHGCTVPFPPNFPSRKLSTFASGTLYTSSTTGFGFITVDPKIGVTNTASPTPITYSAAAYAGTTVATSGTGVSGSSTNSDVAPADIGASAQWRLVAAGLRIRYKGTNIERGGEITGIVETDHLTMAGKSYSDIRKYDEARADSVTHNKWSELTWTPVDREELNFSAALATNTPHMAIVIEAASATTPVAYAWEFYGHYELIGSATRSKSPSYSDIVGADSIWNTVQSVAHGLWSMVPGGSRAPFIRAAYRMLTQTASGATQLLRLTNYESID